MRAALALLVLVLAAGCGGDSGGGSKTFQGDGYSFSYPSDWEQREADIAAGSADVVIAPEPGVTGISVGAFESPQAVTADNIGDFMADLSSGAEQFLAQNVAGSKLEGEVTQVTVGGLPGVTFEGSTTEGGGVHTRGTWIFDGTTFYAINCSSPTGHEDLAEAACDQVLDSFELS